MKPFKILLFFLSVIAGLSIIMFFFPADGIKITNNFTLQFETWDDFWTPVQRKNISQIVENNQVEDTVVFVEEDLFDTMYIDSVQIVYKPVQISVDSNLQILEFPENQDTLLDAFFATLGSLNSVIDKIHILHYGDSQIEVDRMTSYIRAKLQAAFGGFGSGFHQGIQAFNFKQPLVVSYSSNWNRYTMFPRVDTTILHKRYGISTAFTTFIDIHDSSFTEQTAWIKFEKSVVARQNVRKFKIVKLYYGYNSTDLVLNVYTDEALVNTEVLAANQNLQIKTFEFDNPENIKFEYIGTSSPEIYGYSFESNTGVIVDNIPVRGSSGLFFGRNDFSLSAKIYASMNVRLIIMQFGGNAISRDSSGIRAYMSYYKNQINYLKGLAPNAQIIVIGPADMSEKEKNNYVTRKNLPYLVEQMRIMALNNGCVFWNMFEAMGGQNSMPSWVFNDPPLAEKDFIHFTPNGANIVAQMFYKALMLEYNRFVQNQTPSI
ncbi:MAG: hypothetical protein JXR68_04010 [Bacteroidales bacterium]|nr:hypothetical protein [Bacteroidales bacterium]